MRRLAILLLAVLLAPVSAGAQESADRNPAWLVRPNAETVALFYPPNAMAQGVAGRVDLDCIVGLDQRVNCTAASEEPDGWGFAEAAVATSRSFRVSPAVVRGRPAEGRLRVPIRFAQMGDRGPVSSGLDLPLWEDAPGPDAVRAAWARHGHGEGVRARAILSCRVNEDRRLHCTVVRETFAGAGAVALALAPEFKVYSSDADFISRHRDDAFILPINFGFGPALEPVNTVTSGMTPVDVTAPARIAERVYPRAARSAGVTGSATVLCTATDRGLTCVLQSETPEGHGFGAAAQLLGTALGELPGIMGLAEWPFLEGDQMRLVVPFQIVDSASSRVP